MSTSIAGFLGETERGPTTPTLVTSYIQYQRLFGSNFNEEKYLPYAVQGFFENGGQRCYISRIVNTNAVTSSTEFTIGLKTFHIEANGEGAWGNGLAVKVTEDTSPQTPTLKKYKLSIFYWKNPAPAIFDPEAEPLKKPRPTIETYDDVEFDKNQEYYDKKINSSSDLVRIKIITDPSHNLTPATLPLITFLQNGTDSTTANSTPILEDYTRNDTATQGKKKGLTGLNKIDEISILYAPNADKVAGLVKKLITDCETLKNHFLILDTPKTNSISWINTKGRYNTSYAAYYYPWIKVTDPGTGKPRTIPPGGHVAGVYARADVERGVHKAPASEVVHGVIGLEFNMGRGEQDIPNARGVNCIRQFPGRGYQIWASEPYPTTPSGSTSTFDVFSSTSKNPS